MDFLPQAWWHCQTAGTGDSGGSRIVVTIHDSWPGKFGSGDEFV